METEDVKKKTTRRFVIKQKEEDPYTVKAFTKKFMEIHGDKFSLPDLEDKHFDKKSSSMLPIRCNRCGLDFIREYRSCLKMKSCQMRCGTNMERWSLDKFEKSLTDKKKIDNDYQLVKRDSFSKGAWSDIKIICRGCGEVYQQKVHDHITSNHGCPKKCGTRCENWSLEKFDRSLTDEQRKNNDYYLVREDSFRNGAWSILDIFCRNCKKIYPQTVYRHSKGNGCPRLCGKEKEMWSLKKFERLLTDEKKEKNGYHLVNEDSFKDGHLSILKIFCRDCGEIYEQGVCGHIYDDNGCPRLCGKENETWSLKKFERKLTDRQKEKNHYKLVNKDSFDNGKDSILDIFCISCDKPYKQTVHKHINGGHGCPNCNSSKGEEASSLSFDLLDIPYVPQWYYKGYKYDAILFDWDLYEYDGDPHFIQNKHHHRKEGSFEKRQNDDVIKTCMALEMGRRIIRVDYTQIDNIAFHIEEAYKSDRLLYLSTPDMYKYITDNLPPELLHKIKPK